KEERYQTATELLADLKSLKQAVESAAKPGSAGFLSSTVVDLNMQTGAAKRESTFVDDGKLTGQISKRSEPETAKNKKGTLGRLLVAAAILLLIGILVAMFWPSFHPKPAILPDAPKQERSMSYWLMVQKYRNGKPVQKPFRLASEIYFEKGDRVRL